MIHSLKTVSDPFEAVSSGAKTAEYRKNDRGFQVGDTVVLREWIPGGLTEEGGYYTHRKVQVVITHIQKGFGIPEGYVMLSFRVI